MQIQLAGIPFTPSIIKEYLEGTQELKELYTHEISFKNIQLQTEIKQANYLNRNVLTEELVFQHKDLELSKKQIANLENLKNENTFTLTTGHQLNIATGPIYCIYKILQTLKTCDELNKLPTKNNYVPLFWMASEDHDFEEINHFYFQQEKTAWQTNQKGAVGRFQIAELKTEMQQFLSKNTHQPNFQEVEKLFNASYLKEETLAKAHRNLIHELFKEFGLLIIDGDSKNLKNLFRAFCKEELRHQKSFQNITQSAEKIRSLGHKIQVNPREINLFYLSKEGRNRIEKTEKGFKIVDTNLQFSATEMIAELENYPEKFSPNALLRPLYQEIILPNVAYIGGNAEIAYWLELKSTFDEAEVPFPILIPRNSFVLFKDKVEKKCQKLQLELTDLLQNKELIQQKIIQNFSTLDLGLEDKINQIEKIFTDLIEQSKKTDKTLENLLLAEKAKQLKAFTKIEKRLLKAEKRVHQEKLAQLDTVLAQIYPNTVFQERRINVLDYFFQENNLLLSLYQSINCEKPSLNFLKI